MSNSALSQYRKTWENKPVLRTLYADFYRRIVAACVQGRTLEIGGGSGNLKDVLPEVISTDIQWAPWLERSANRLNRK